MTPAPPGDAPGTAPIASRLDEAADLVTVALDELLPRVDGPESRLTEAMRYGALGPGRRLRSFVALETARLFAVEERAVLRAACALECVHAGDAVASGAVEGRAAPAGPSQRPSVREQYGAAAALLAGRALHAAAFEILAHPDTHADGAVRADLAHGLARAAGAQGLCGARMIEALETPAAAGPDGPRSDAGDLGAAVRMQRMRTGALIVFAVEIPAIVARVQEARRVALRGFAQDLGLAYGIAEEVRRSRRGERARAGFVALLGLEGARERVSLLAVQCKTHLEIFGAPARRLRDSVDFVLNGPA